MDKCALSALPELVKIDADIISETEWFKQCYYKIFKYDPIKVIKIALGLEKDVTEECNEYFYYGNRGTGKTFLFKQLGLAVEELKKENDIILVKFELGNLEIARIITKENNSLVQYIIDYIRKNIIKTGIDDNIDSFADRLANILSYNNKKLIILIDGIDQFIYNKRQLISNYNPNLDIKELYEFTIKVNEELSRAKLGKIILFNRTEIHRTIEDQKLLVGYARSIDKQWFNSHDKETCSYRISVLMGKYVRYYFDYLGGCDRFLNSTTNNCKTECPFHISFNEDDDICASIENTFKTLVRSSDYRPRTCIYLCQQLYKECKVNENNYNKALKSLKANYKTKYIKHGLLLLNDLYGIVDIDNHLYNFLFNDDSINLIDSLDVWVNALSEYLNINRINVNNISPKSIIDYLQYAKLLESTEDNKIKVNDFLIFLYKEVEAL